MSLGREALEENAIGSRKGITFTSATEHVTHFDSRTIARSAVIRKLAHIDGTDAVVSCSDDMLEYVRAACCVPRTPEELISWLYAQDYLLLQPHLEDILAAASNALREITTSPIEGNEKTRPPAYGQRLLHRRFLERQLDTVPPDIRVLVEEAGQTYAPNLFLGDGDIVDAGHDTNAEPDPVKNPASVMEAVLGCLRLVAVKSRSGCSDVIEEAWDLRREMRSQWDLRGRRVLGSLETHTVKGLCALMRFSIYRLLDGGRGAREILSTFRHIPKGSLEGSSTYILHMAVFTLYAAECGAAREMSHDIPRPLFVLNIDELHALDEAYSSRRLPAHTIIPIPRAKRGHKTTTVPTLPYQLSDTELRGTGRCRLATSIADIRKNLQSRCRWLLPLLDSYCSAGRPRYLTGSLLTAAIETDPRDDPNCVPADVDIFCAQDELEKTAFDVIATTGGGFRLFSDFSGRPYKYTIAAESISCDVYVQNPWAIARYHLPLVRACFTGKALHVMPSCAVALVTGVNVDYKYFKGNKSPLEIILKKWLAGYTLVVNVREQRQFAAYARGRIGQEEWLNRFGHHGSMDRIFLRSFDVDENDMETMRKERRRIDRKRSHEGMKVAGCAAHPPGVMMCGRVGGRA